MLYDSLVSVFIIFHILFQDNKSFIIQIKNVLCHDYVNAYKDTKLDHSKFLDPIVKCMY